jgi:hypothetical protein
LANHTLKGDTSRLELQLGLDFITGDIGNNNKSLKVVKFVEHNVSKNIETISIRSARTLRQLRKKKKIIGKF